MHRLIRRLPPRPTDMRGWLLLCGLLSALLMVLSSLGPWLVAWTPSLNDDGGLQRGHGWLVLLAAVVGAALLFGLRQRRTAGASALLAGLVGLGITLHAATHIDGLRPQHGIAGVGIKYGFGDAGWGLDLAMAASLALALCGLVWLLTLADSDEERTTDERDARGRLAELH